MEGQFWALSIWLGPLILGLVIAYAMLRRRRLTGAETRARDEATHRMYDEPE